MRSWLRWIWRPWVCRFQAAVNWTVELLLVNTLRPLRRRLATARARGIGVPEIWIKIRFLSSALFYWHCFLILIVPPSVTEYSTYYLPLLIPSSLHFYNFYKIFNVEFSSKDFPPEANSMNPFPKIIFSDTLSVGGFLTGNLLHSKTTF